MDGLELFESTLVALPEKAFSVANVSYAADGSTIATEEEWHFDGPDRFRYTVYKIEGGDRDEWISGEWVRYEEND